MRLVCTMAPENSGKGRAHSGFTLIEMTIVLVIIGFIVGGVLVGQSLISAAGARATLAQVEKFNQAVNTFRGKTGFLPGDITPSLASQFGLTSRSGYAGIGDGNGVVEGVWQISCPTGCNNGLFQAGETMLFWQDLLSMNLLDGVSSTGCPGTPAAKIGNANCFFVWSGGVAGGNGINYFDLSSYVNDNGYGRCSNCLASNPGLTVAQAYSIDQKIDDGLPQAGRVKSLYLSANNQGNAYISWAGAGTSNLGGIPAASDAGYTTATLGSSTTCFDNGNTAGNPQQYSVEVSNGSNVSCALSFQFQ